MKDKKYQHGTKIVFCPNCHRQIDFPFNGIVVNGTINLGCGNCGKGRVIIESKPND